MEMLTGLEEVSRGAYRWSETAGLKQLIRSRRVSEEETTEWLKRDIVPYGQMEFRHAFG